MKVSLQKTGAAFISEITLKVKPGLNVVFSFFVLYRQNISRSYVDVFGS